MNKTLYIIEGHTGDYDDKYSWDVKAYFSESKANSVLADLNEVADKTHAKHFKDEDDGDDYQKFFDKEEELLAELRVLDPKASISYPGVNYKIKTLDLEVDDE